MPAGLCLRTVESAGYLAKHVFQLQELIDAQDF